nr:integrase, catalytic region, zinc finger, CCHC-type, peptidase aspartic, catalytic [Tanacetum cinerariifolium]
TQFLIAQKEEAGIQLQAKKFDFMDAAGDLDEIEKVNANCILMENLQQASTSGHPNMFMVRRLGMLKAYDRKSKASQVYFIEGFGYNQFLVEQFCDSDLESWLWHQHLTHLNFDTINDLAKNDLVSGLPKFKCHKEHLCSSCEQEKIKKASHPPKPVPNSKQRLHLYHMDLCDPMRVESINRKRKPYISFLHVFEALCYPKNDPEDIRKLGAKGDIGFFIGYSDNSYDYKVYNRRTKKIMETMDVTFDELLAMAFEQCRSKPGLQSMTFR